MCQVGIDIYNSKTMSLDAVFELPKAVKKIFDKTCLFCQKLFLSNHQKHVGNR